MNNKKNLLILTPTYPDSENKVLGDPFVKSYVDSISDYFNKIYVISAIPYSISFLKKFFHFAQPNLKNYEYNNIEVYYPKFFHLPIKYFRERLGDNQFKVVDKLIQKLNLKFDIIHAHFTWPSGYVGVKIKEKYGKKLVITAHGSDIREWRNNLHLHNMNIHILDKADVIHTNHEEIKDIIKSVYKPKNLVFTYKGINIETFDPYDNLINQKAQLLRHKLELGNKFIVLFIGNLVDFKDPITLLKTAILLKGNKDIHFIIVGKGALEKKILSMISMYDLYNVSFLGQRKDIPELLALSNVFVALSPIENIWSTTLQEAFVMGKPSIITSAGYTNKLLKNEIDAILIRPQSEFELKEAILKLFYDKNLYNRLSKNALGKYRRLFDISELKKTNYDLLYKNLMK